MPLPPPRVEPSPRWIRVRAGDVEVANSRRALLLAWYGPGRLPTYCLPPEDVRTELLRPAGNGASNGFLVHHDVHADGQVLARAAHLLRDPPPPLEAADGHWTFAWDGQVRWFEEAEEVVVHARDTAKRVDVRRSERHVRIGRAGVVIADSRRPRALFETGLPTRWYLPLDDVNQALLVPSDTLTRCPYKGTASYWSVQIGERLHPDLAWTYREPLPECPGIAGMAAFFDERVDVEIDGVRQERPRSPWSVGAGGLAE